MVLSSLSVRVVLGVLLAFYAVGTMASWSTDSPYINAPSDGKLIEKLHNHRAAFERLRQMVTEDLKAKSYFSDSDLDGKLPESRKQEYRSLLSEIQPGLIVTVDYDKAVRFIFASGGASAIGPGWLKAIQFTSDEGKQKGTKLQNLDNPNTLPVGVYFREIEPNWCVLYQRTD